MDGILNVRKPTGMTSHDVVARVRKVLGQRRVGHAGTLDPAASGVLPICVGQGTRVAEYLSEAGKEYRGTVILGIETETYDSEGEITRRASTAEVDRARIEEALAGLRGPQMQVPPRYSAIKIQGQAAYKRARAGEEIELAARPVEISRLEMVSWQNPVLALEITCSKGTYIRSLAHDLGRALGCGAHLSELVRTRSGPFRLEESILLEELAEARARDQIGDYLWSPAKALEHYPTLHLDAAESARVAHGSSFRDPVPKERHITGETLARVYNAEGKFIAIAAWEPRTEQWQPRKVFATG